jgi:hypothetical protein
MEPVRRTKLTGTEMSSLAFDVQALLAKPIKDLAYVVSGVWMTNFNECLGQFMMMGNQDFSFSPIDNTHLV